MVFVLLVFGPFFFLMIRNAMGIPDNIKSSFQHFFLVLFLTLIAFYFLALYEGQYNRYIKGYRSTSFLFIIMSVTGILYWLIDRNKIFNDGYSIFKNMFRSFLFLFTILIIGLAFPLSLEIVDDYYKQLYYNDDNFRIEDTRRGINEPCEIPTLFVKENFYEKKFNQPTLVSKNCYSNCFDKSEISKIEIKPITINHILVYYYFNSTDKFKNCSNPLSVEYIQK